MTYKNIEVEAVTPHIGASITGVDLSKKLDGQTWEEIHRAFAEHLVIFFPGQDLPIEGHLTFAKEFGELDPPLKLPKYSAEYPQFSLIESDGSKVVVGNRWHCDNTDYLEPPLGAAMYAETLPESGGGDTSFSSMYTAYDMLSDRMKEILNGMTALHDNSNVQSHYKSSGVISGSGMEVDEPSEHPIVRTHPVTGRKALFVNAVYSQSIVGLHKTESDALLGMLFEHVKSPDFSFRLQWKPGTLTLWDNRCVQHFASADYNGLRRMRRVVIKGDRPF